MGTRQIAFVLVASLAVAGCKEQPANDEARNAGIRTAEPTAAPVVAARAKPAARASWVEKSRILAADPAFTALSAAEADWLKRNGFLSHEESRRLQALGERALLERSRDRGDMAAATALGMLRLRSGDARGAAISFDIAARSGSLHALEQLAYAELQDARTASGTLDRVSEENAQALFVARMEQARIMGDHRVDFYIEQVAGGLDRQRYGDQILRQTTEFMRQMGEDAAIRGVPARGPDARPNIDLWRAAALDPQGSISATMR